MIKAPEQFVQLSRAAMDASLAIARLSMKSAADAAIAKTKAQAKKRA